MKVIIVDDDVVLRELIRVMLHNNRHEVIGEASDGETALQLCEASRPDLVLLDIMLRDSNGLKVLEKLRSAYPDLPVVMVSGQAYVDVIESARAMGARVFVGKPYNAERLMKAIARATGASQA